MNRKAEEREKELRAILEQNKDKRDINQVRLSELKLLEEKARLETDLKKAAPPSELEQKHAEELAAVRLVLVGVSLIGTEKNLVRN